MCECRLYELSERVRVRIRSSSRLGHLYGKPDGLKFQVQDYEEIRPVLLRKQND